MNLSEPFIRRPVMTSLVMISLLFFGLICYDKLPVSDLPDVNFPMIQVTVANPGSSPEVMANTVAVPLEQQFMSIQGLQTIVSQSMTGQTFILLQFALDRSLDGASVDVQAAISRAQPNLPQNLPYNPTYRQINPSQTPIIYMILTSPSMDLAELYDYSYTFIAKRLSMISGVAQVITYGSPYAARIQLNPEELAAKGIGLDDVVQAVKEGNVDLPVGTLFGPKREFTIDVDGQITKAAGYNTLAVKSKNGAIVRIQDIGRAIDSLQDDKYTLKYFTPDTQAKSVVLAIQTQPGANTIKVSEAVDKLLPSIQKELPSSLQYHTMFKKADVINESVKDVKLTLFVAFVLVVLIIYFSLGKAMNTIIPSLAIPLSILGTFTLMYLFGFSIDILSLLAITLSIGFLVDDAVVVLENNVRHVQMGEDPFQASIKGAKEISITILSMTLCLACVFIPMLFLGGIIGRLFREFAVTIFVAVLFSGFISLSLTPLLCSRFIPPYRGEEKKTWMESFADLLHGKFLNVYRIMLEWSLSHRVWIFSLGAISFFLSAFLLVSLPKDFLPNDDQGFIQGFAETKDGTSPFEMGRLQDQVAEILRKDPNVESVFSACSMAGLSTDNEGLLFLRLKPFRKRASMDAIIQSLMEKTSHVPGINTYLSPVPLISLQIGYAMKALYQYTLTSIDSEELKKAVPLFMHQMQTMPGIVQVSSDLQIQQPQLFISIDRDRASDLKISASQIENLFGYAYSNGKISTINTPINQYQVIVETLPSFYKDPTVLSSLFIKNQDNDMVPLSQIVRAEERIGPLTVSRVNGLAASTISFNLDNIPLGTAMEHLNKIANEALPPTVSGSDLGATDVFSSSFADLSFLFLITLFTIYVILGILYESFIHPITVMSALPPAVLGGLFTLYLFDEALSLYSFVGLIMLLGIVMKNGIMMVDFANSAIREEKKSAMDAIVSACLVRFRPIMMTTLAALMGAVPIALGIGGASAQARIPLGLVIIGGLIFSQILTLFLTPVMFYYFEVLHEKIERMRKKNKPPISREL